MTAARLEESLREDVEAALAEAALAQERQQLLQLEVTDLQRQRNELAARGEEISLTAPLPLLPSSPTLLSVLQLTFTSLCPITIS